MPKEVSFVWATACVILIAGYLAIMQPSESEIAMHATSSSMLAERIDRMHEILQNEAALRSAQQRVVQEFSSIVTPNREISDGLLLHSIASETRRAGIAILSLTSSPISKSDHMVMSRDVAMSVRGTYRGLLVLLPRLSLVYPLFEIQSVAIHAQGPAAHLPLATILQVDITARCYQLSPHLLEGIQAHHDT